jgi:hypothetical protein
MGGPEFNRSVIGDDRNSPPKGFGVLGMSTGARGVVGQSDSGSGVHGFSTDGAGVFGNSDNSPGVFGEGGQPERFFPIVMRAGVLGTSTVIGTGVVGITDISARADLDDITPAGVFGKSKQAPGVVGQSERTGVSGESVDGVGVVGNSRTHYGVMGISTNSIGLYGSGAFLAAHLKGNVKIEGNVEITGSLNKDGGRFKIDHPLDPANKYLSHSFVESPDMKNVYDGVVTLDDKGEAEIELPDWFGVLNKDFRYQLTAIGAPGPNLYIAEEISSDGVVTTTTTRNYSRTRSSNNSNKNKNNNSSSWFKVAGGASGMKVSWQVTGIRMDPWANAHRISVEEDKPDKERGYYTYPELYGQPEEKGISRLLVPEIEKELLLINDNQNKRPKIKIPSS